MTTPRKRNPLKPEFAIFWHPTLNGDETPDKYSNSSGFKPWWQCALKHDFKAAIRDFTNGHGCPYCAGNKAWAGYNDLATLRPEMAAQWHPGLNDILPTQVTVASKTKVWWTGECGHDFFASVGARTVSGTACPYCAGQKILIGFNDLATTHPDIVKQWHPTKNIEYTPQSITAGTNKKVWWIGECGHEFFVGVAERIRVGASKGCLYCAGKKILAGFNDLASNFPDIAKELSPSNKLKADEVSAKSTVKYLWVCSNGHEYMKAVRDRTRNNARCNHCSSKVVD